MRIIYMGTPEFAVHALEAVIKAGHEVAAVFTQPDKPVKRSGRPVPTPVKVCAASHGIPVYQPEKIKAAESVDIIKELSPEAIVVAAYGQILSEDILNIPKYGCVNIHASLLPKYRGAAPIEWAIINGEKTTGVTTMYMAKGLDTGDMIEKSEVPITSSDTGSTLTDKLASEGAELIISTLEKLEAGNAVRHKQDDALSSYAPMLDRDLGRIDFNRSAEEIERLIRGLIPWPCAYTTIDGRTVKIYEASVSKADVSAYKAGEIADVTKKTFSIACGTDFLVVKSLKPDGKKQMDTAAFLNGNKIQQGMICG